MRARDGPGPHRLRGAWQAVRATLHVARFGAPRRERDLRPLRGPFNALNVATQHIASTSGSRREASGLRLALYLARNPLWLFGWAAGLGGFAFQAAALDKGQLSIVQALLVTELVFGLLLRKVWIGQTIRRAAWGSAALTCCRPRGLRLASPAARWHSDSER